jgi:hypothetical protein
MCTVAPLCTCYSARARSVRKGPRTVRVSPMVKEELDMPTRHFWLKTWLPQRRYDEPDWRSTENCLKWGADPNYRFKDGSSLLCIGDHMSGKDPAQFGSAPWSRRSLTCRHVISGLRRGFKPEMTCRHVKLLLDHGADPNCAGSFPDMWSPLHLA